MLDVSSQGTPSCPQSLFSVSFYYLLEVSSPDRARLLCTETLLPCPGRSRGPTEGLCWQAADLRGTVFPGYIRSALLAEAR